MQLFLRIDLNIISIIMITVMFPMVVRRLDTSNKMIQTFFAMVLVIFIQLIIETLTCLINGQSLTQLIGISVVLHTILFALSPLISFLWCVFLYRWAIPQDAMLLKDIKLLAIPLGCHLILTVVNLFTHISFFITAANVYHRGPFFYLSTLAAFFYLFYGLLFLLKKKNELTREIFVPFLFFAIFPTIGGVLQLLFPGVLLMWSSAAFSLIIVFIFIQQWIMQFDMMTGAWTKDTFQRYISHKIQKEHSHVTFGVIFIDLDNFKKINDSYGHLEGDSALKTTVSLMQYPLRKTDIVARVGGDEFVIIIEQGSNVEIEAIIIKIKDSFAAYNKTSGKPYILEYSFGFEIFDSNKHDIEAFLKHVDNLMYMNKLKKKQEQQHD